MLEEALVAFVPGEAFGAPGYGRFSYALSDEDLVRGVERLAALLSEVERARTMARILVTERLSPRGLEQMAAAGHDVDVQLGAQRPTSSSRPSSGRRRSSSARRPRVTAEVLEAGRSLVVVGRAGIGLDNVDVEAATRRGVMVVNAPESNILSAAEHAFALLLAQARNIPQAHAALVAGRWERGKWEGVELHGKTLGIVGLGRVGALVAQRAAAFGMRLVAYDPYVTPDRARKMGVELVEPRGARRQCSDFVTHPPAEDARDRRARSARSCSPRPSPASASSTPPAAASSTRRRSPTPSRRDGSPAPRSTSSPTEPCTSSPLFELEQVVVTPHLGASTAEAQDKAGEQIAEQIVLALRGDFVPYAVNVAAAGASEGVRPFLGVAERLGRLLAALCDGVPERPRGRVPGSPRGRGHADSHALGAEGRLRGRDRGARLVRERSAPRRGAGPRGARVLDDRRRRLPEPGDASRWRPRGRRGPLGRTGAERIVMVDDHAVELPFAPNLLIVRNDDRPGMIGIVGAALGDAGVSITNMAVGQTSGGGTALMLLSTDRPVPREVLGLLRNAAGILDLHYVADA